jgi:nitrilase
LRDKEIQESKNFLAGNRLATGRVSDFKVGMTVCYDLRFPGLFVEYARRGCDVLTVPASFTFQTGEAHWEVLLRARAIENLSYILAPNQCGTTPNGVRTYGNSMVIDPWGRILARAATDGEEIIYAELQRETLKTARSALPAVRRQQQIFQRDIYLE